MQRGMATLCTYHGSTYHGYTYHGSTYHSSTITYQVQQGIAAILALGNLDFGDSPDDQAALLPTSC